MKFGSEISLRGRLGKYLTALPTIQPVKPAIQSSSSGGNTPRESSPIVNNQSTSSGAMIPTSGTAPATAQPQSQAFLLGVEGQGIGEQLDSFVFVNADNR